MRQRADRWDHHPVLNIDGDPIRVLRPTDNDLAKFELLTHYRTLSCPFIASILEDDPESDRKRLKVLAAEPNRYLNLYNRDKQRLLIGLNGYQWYTLSRRGVDTLRGRGRDIHGSVEGNGREFAHELGINGTLGSIDIGIRQTGGARMVYADEIYNHPNFPDQTRKSHSPFSLKLSIRKKFATGTIHEKTFNYRPDGLRAIRYASGDWQFMIFEYEHMNRADSSNFNTTSFLMKFLAVQSIVEKGLCDDRWGIPPESFFTLVAAGSQHHVDSMKNVILRETSGKGCDYIAFQVFPSLMQTLSILPKPELYTAGWQRAGFSDLYLGELEG